jgi:hypothetical protein
MVYELRVDEQAFKQRPQDFKAVEFLLMKQTKNQSGSQAKKLPFYGTSLKGTIPRMEMLDCNMTLLEVKQLLYTKLRPVWPEGHKIHGEAETLNESLILHIYDNLPYYRDKKNYRFKATCEFCQTPHGLANTCDIRIKDVSGNSMEGARTLRLKDVFSAMEHNRDLVLSVIFKEKSDYQPKLLEFELDMSHKESKGKDKEMVTLDACLRAFSREELLNGNDQWYCNRCKQQQDIHKKLELYRLPKILIV